MKSRLMLPPCNSRFTSKVKRGGKKYAPNLIQKENKKNLKNKLHEYVRSEGITEQCG